MVLLSHPIVTSEKGIKQAFRRISDLYAWNIPIVTPDNGSIAKILII